jgi:hypothetical protein
VSLVTGAATFLTGAVAGPLLIATGVVGLAASGASYYINSENNKNHEKHTTKLRESLLEDIKEYDKFQTELFALSDEGFGFELGLENKNRVYKGNGRDQFRRLTDQVIPSLVKITIDDKPT